MLGREKPAGAEAFAPPGTHWSLNKHDYLSILTMGCSVAPRAPCECQGGQSRGPVTEFASRPAGILGETTLSPLLSREKTHFSEASERS